MDECSANLQAVPERLSAVPHVVTLGNFDGVHRGHQYLIAQVVEEGRRQGIDSLVVTFEPHPVSVLRPGSPFTRLTTPDEKIRLLKETTATDVFVIPFTPTFAALSAEEFLQLLDRWTAPRTIFVGEGFRFGRQRGGDGETIREFGARHGIETHVITRIRDGERMISSSAIREALLAGDIKTANHFLGRRYRLSGTVEHGAARGRELGFPTANLLLPDDACLPADGIYAAYAQIPDGDDRVFEAMVYVGTRPTFDGGKRIVEANLLDFDGDLYTARLDIDFVAYIRADEKFATAQELSDQMECDEQRTRAVFQDLNPSKPSWLEEWR